MSQLKEITSNILSTQNAYNQTIPSQTLTTSLSSAFLENFNPGRVEDFDHVTFWVGNAKQSALYFINQFGFEPFAFRGLESGSRDVASHVVKINTAILKFESAIEPNTNDYGEFICSHGDAVKDVAFRVTNIDAFVNRAVQVGAEIVKPLKTIQLNEKEAGLVAENNAQQDISTYYVKTATIRAFGDITHTFIERNFEYFENFFLPGYSGPTLKRSAIYEGMPRMQIIKTDHVVGQFPPNKLDDMESWYRRVMEFSRFWSVDEKQIYTEHSGVKSHVMANYNEQIMMPLCEVMLSKNSKSKAEEFVRYHNGPGIHHIALLTDDIVSVVHYMRLRGTDFLYTPDTYYDQLKERLKDCRMELNQDIEVLRKLRILVDFDEKGYLLQIFTRPITDRPTIVFEFIQRYNHNGFGAGNFLALFKAIEAETRLRASSCDGLHNHSTYS